MTDRRAGDDTTPAEYDATYQSLVGLEPEIMAAVADEARRPRGSPSSANRAAPKSTRAATISAAGDELDRCFTTWLSGSVDRDAAMRREIGELAGWGEVLADS